MPDSQTPGGNTSEAPAPEVLQAEDDAQTSAAETGEAKPSDKPATDTKSGQKPRRLSYRPSHKATFIGLAVVLVILAINGGVVYFFIQNQANSESQVQREEVTISTEALEKLGVNRTAVGNLGTELVVGPDSRFNGKVSVSGDAHIAGQLSLNSKISAADASLTKLQAGDTSLEQLNVNGDGTLTNLSLRSNLAVAGTTLLQGAVTVNNNMNIIGSLTVGGSLFAGSFQATNLVAGSTLTLGGHVVTRGTAPGVSSGPAIGSNGTVSISGSDAAGTVAVNAGSGAGNGVIANVSFQDAYGGTPHVVITAIGQGAGDIYVNRNANGFSIGVDGALPAGGYAFDFIVVQ